MCPHPWDGFSLAIVDAKLPLQFHKERQRNQGLASTFPVHYTRWMDGWMDGCMYG